MALAGVGRFSAVVYGGQRTSRTGAPVPGDAARDAEGAAGGSTDVARLKQELDQRKKPKPTV